MSASRPATTIAEGERPSAAAPAASAARTRKGSELDHDARLLVEAVSGYAVYRLTAEGFVASWNAGAERNKGYSPEEAIGLHFSCFYTQAEREAGQPEKMLLAARHSKVDTYGWRVRKDGSRFWAHVVIEAIRGPDGSLLGFAKVTCDMTAEKLDHDQLVRNLDAALSNMSQGLCLFDAEERIVLSNPRVGEMFGLAPSAFAPGTRFVDLFRSIVSQGGPLEQLREVVSDGYDHHRRIIAQPNGGSTVLKVGSDRVFSIAHRSMADGSWVSTFADISERIRTESQVAHMALHDALTDLPNRVFFHQRMIETLRRVTRGEACAVLCLDLDRFKTVNDTLGHPVGDALLVSVAKKLRGLIRETDMVARLGGDEFAIILGNVKRTNDTTDFAARLIRVLGEPQDVGDHLVVTGASIGIALAPDDGIDPDKLLKCADLALYRAKSGGRGRFCFFEPEMDALLQKRRLLELDLRTALAAREFELYYQPIVDIDRNVLHRLRELGVSISMDDFGTGYSSLGYLRSFPFDKIKIDKSFVQGLGDAADCTAIVQAVMGICGSLGIVATAEGVETQGQMDLLRSRHCHQAQGYLISRPCPASDIPKLLSDFPGTPALPVSDAA